MRTSFMRAALAAVAGLVLGGTALAGAPGPDHKRTSDILERTYSFEDTARIDLELEGEVTVRARAKTRDAADELYADPIEPSVSIAPARDLAPLVHEAGYRHGHRRYGHRKYGHRRYGYHPRKHRRYGRGYGRRYGKVKIIERPCATRIIRFTPRGRIVRVIRHCGPYARPRYRGYGYGY